ncbi:MAG: manganese-dependent inorganic pyrophosphatase [Candidatus Nanoarchaeia archaeon]|nr:manganese-dependent inorganic pyrophosphatase [Candidatus Nanoarchaeia archaeon]
MTDIIIIGHKNQDLDSVASSIAYAELKKALGIDCEAFVFGKIDDETKFILDKFKIKIPKTIDSLIGKKVILVDHCANCQMADGFEGAEIIEIIDHHNMAGDIKTSKPIKYHCEPLGSTSTIIAKYYFDEGIKINENIAKLLLAAMISDMDLFKSPTTTNIDLKIKDKLNEIAKLDIEKLGIEMFKAKSNIDKKTDEELMNDDSKEFELPRATKALISQIKLMELDSFIKNRKTSMMKLMESKLNNYGLIIVIVTDLIKEGSELIAVGKTDMVEEAMKIRLKNNSAYIPGLLSRKKQVIPPLMELK